MSPKHLSDAALTFAPLLMNYWDETRMPPTDAEMKLKLLKTLARVNRLVDKVSTSEEDAGSD